MRFWDPDHSCYLYGDVQIVTGRQATHHITDSEFWLQKESPLAKWAPERDAYPSYKEVAKAPLIQADVWIGSRSEPPIGRPIETVQRRRCRGCGKSHAQRQLSGRLRLCPRCTGGRRAAA